MIEKKSIPQHEAELSKENSKSVDLEKFKIYAQKKLILNRKLEHFYGQYIFRKLRLGAYFRTQISEAKLINNIKKKFGAPENVVICIGDWEQHSHRKFKEPTKGIGFRKTLRRAGYKVFLVDEFRTSARCSKCGGECENFRRVPNPKPSKENLIICHGLVRCQGCHVLWNRDVNAASNIYKIAENALNGLERPDYLSRGQPQ